MSLDGLEERLRQAADSLGVPIYWSASEVHSDDFQGDEAKDQPVVPGTRIDLGNTPDDWARSPIHPPTMSPCPGKRATKNQTPGAANPYCKEDAASKGILAGSSLQLGQPVPADLGLCPWKQVTGYCNNYIGKANKSRALPYFEEALNEMDWDFFYLHNPAQPKGVPWLLVPTAQFIDFLEYVNRILGTSLCIPRGLEKLFRVKFNNEGPFRPRFLLKSTSQVSFNKRPQPKIDDEDATAWKDASPEQQQLIWKRLEAVITRSPETMKKLKDREKERQAVLYDAQRMLGLKARSQPLGVVFVAIDFEALERATDIVSEVGIAILDTREIEDVAPGPCGRDWWPFIRAFHLRVREYSGLRNYQFIQGCPDAFDFGTSTFPPKSSVAKEILAVLKPWCPAGRDLVVVGHNVEGDLNYLSKVGVDVGSLRFMLRVDSMTLHQTWRKLTNGKGLEAVLSDLCISHKNLHNAGNDAVYSLRAVLGVAAESVREEAVIAAGEKFVPALFTAP